MLMLSINRKMPRLAFCSVAGCERRSDVCNYVGSSFFESEELLATPLPDVDRSINSGLQGRHLLRKNDPFSN